MTETQESYYDRLLMQAGSMQHLTSVTVWCDRDTKIEEESMHSADLA